MEKIDAVNMTREIRDKQSKEIEGKSTEEIIDYFRKKAKRFYKQRKNAKLN